MGDMERIIICRHCGKPEYYGKMRWLNGKCECRDCYKHHYEETRHKAYIWDDLDGKRPGVEEFIEQQREKLDRMVEG